jgi:dCTP deaminase
MGRSSIGRLGVYVQISADLGHLGAAHKWTLELHVVQPVRLYPGMEIGQVCFWAANPSSDQYKGIYGRQDLPTPAQLRRLRR